MAIPLSSRPYQFLRAFGYSWATRMSGPLSVPFTLAALFVDNIFAKVLCAFLAIVCAVFAAYSIWKNEREALIKTQLELDKVITPKIHIEHNANTDIRSSEVMSSSNAKSTITTYAVRIVNECA